MLPNKFPKPLFDTLHDIQEEYQQEFTNFKDTVTSDNLIFPEDLEDVAKKSGIPQKDVSQLLSHIFVAEYYFSSGDEDTKTNEALDLYTQLAANHSDEQGRKLTKTIISSFGEIAFSENINQLNKINELAYNHPDNLNESNIVIDARPLFDKDHENIKTYIILAFLRLRLSRHSEPELLTVHMDRSDIEELKFQCEKAISKMDKVAAQLAETTKKPVYLPGVKGKSEK